MAPQSLSATRYSTTAAEIFWQRSSDSDGVVIAYEVARDGEVLETRDASSLFDNSLESERSYTYTVTAIDNTGERSVGSTVQLNTFGATSVTQDIPTAPANLRVEIYSSTAFELFWDRPENDGLNYLLLNAGNVVNSAPTDATSLYVVTDMNSAVQYELVAVNSADQRSMPINLQIDLGTRTAQISSGGGAMDTGTDIDSDSGGSIPEIQRIEIYSTTAAELFWERIPGSATTVEVLRDNVSIGRTDGTSFFDGTRQPGFTYVYSLAIDDGDSEPVMNDDNPLSAEEFANTLLPTVFSVFTGKQLGSEILALATAPSRGFVEQSALLASNCENDGSLNIEVLGEASSLNFGTVRSLNNCEISGRILNGSTRVSDLGGLIGAQVASMEDSLGGESFEGNVDHQFGGLRGGSPARHYALTDSRYDSEGIVLDNATFRYDWVAPFRYEFSGGFSLLSPDTADTQITVSVTEPLLGGVNELDDFSVNSSPGDFVFFVDGVLRVDSANGDFLQVEANTGDAATFQVIGQIGGEALEPAELRWENFADELEFQFDLIE